MYFGIKAHVGADAESGLVRTIFDGSGKAHVVTDVPAGNSLLHSDETVVFGDAKYQGLESPLMQKPMSLGM